MTKLELVDTKLSLNRHSCLTYSWERGYKSQAIAATVANFSGKVQNYAKLEYWRFRCNSRLLCELFTKNWRGRIIRPPTSARVKIVGNMEVQKRVLGKPGGTKFLYFPAPPPPHPHRWQRPRMYAMKLKQIGLLTFSKLSRGRKLQLHFVRSAANTHIITGT